ncbi:hypothetical protein [Sulfurimonas sp.]
MKITIASIIMLFFSFQLEACDNNNIESLNTFNISSLKSCNEYIYNDNDRTELDNQLIAYNNKLLNTTTTLTDASVNIKKMSDDIGEVIQEIGPTLQGIDIIDENKEIMKYFDNLRVKNKSILEELKKAENIINSTKEKLSNTYCFIIGLCNYYEKLITDNPNNHKAIINWQNTQKRIKAKSNAIYQVLLAYNTFNTTFMNLSKELNKMITHINSVQSSIVTFIDYDCKRKSPCQYTNSNINNAIPDIYLYNQFYSSYNYSLKKVIKIAKEGASE